MTILKQSDVLEFFVLIGVPNYAVPGVVEHI